MLDEEAANGLMEPAFELDDVEEGPIILIGP